MHFEFLPNEILIECFQYLNAPDIFHSFDQLNSRFSKLLRNIPLHLNFQRFKTNLFYEFCQIILSNPEIKQNIISLRLSNDGRCGQIKSFLSLISLNEFIHLRSLSFIDFNRHNTEQLLPILPFLSNLYYFSFTFADDKSLKIIPILFQFKIRILTIPTFNSYLRSIDKTMSVTSLTISEIHLLPLYKLLEYVPMLKYLQIKDFDDSDTEDDTSNLIHRNAVYLKTFIVDYSNVEFHIFEFLLKCFPNLKTFSIMNSDEIEMIDANRWQYLIESSLPYLHTFKFNFLDYSHTCYDEKVIKLQLFQTDFWTKQHQWYIDFEIDCFSAAVYTIPH
ncbi:unnamed protein product [Rotaria sordida]|uniref:F-box domain-containing protein n=1 Tax=Rotaria sordida TaxID=392033 RepID=A0A814SNB0_9BILA|nr:unnamed protein product [Rotaria sordida]